MDSLRLTVYSPRLRLEIGEDRAGIDHFSPFTLHFSQEIAMKILITDSIDQEGVDILSSQKGFEVVVDLSLKGDKLAENIGPYHALITRSGTDVTAGILKKAQNLKVIGRAGVGVDNVDIEAASRKGVVVLNAPTGNTLLTRRLCGKKGGEVTEMSEAF